MNEPGDRIPTGRRISYFGPDPVATADDSWEQFLITIRKTHVIGFDVETVNIKDRRLVGLSIATSPRESWYWPWDSPLLPLFILCDPSITKVAHNAPYDLDVLWDYGVDGTNIEDTAVMSRFENYFPATLDAMAIWVNRQPPTPMGKVMKQHKVKRVDQLPYGIVAGKCLLDSQITLSLYEWFLDRGLQDVSWEYYKREMKIIPLLLDMGRRGLELDHDRVIKHVIEYDRKMQYNKAICEGLNFNPGSLQQVGYTLASRGSWLPMTKKKRQLATDNATLKRFAGGDPLIQNILNYRHEQTMLNTYLGPWLGDDRATTRFNLDARTARISSADYNLTNIPHELRDVFVGDFVDVDDSQLELRKLQYLSGDQRMKEVFDHDESIHRDTARLLYGSGYSDIQYRSSKNTNFCIIYGGRIPRIADTAGVSMAEAARIQRAWSQGYPEAWAWLQRTSQAAVRGEKVETVGGRKMLIMWDEEGEEGVRKRAVNYPIQTSAGETLREQMLLAWCPAMVVQIHDELMFDRNIGEMPWPRKDLEEMLEWVGPVRTPVSVKEFTRWPTD